MVYTRTRNSTYAQYARAAGANAQFTIPTQRHASFGLGDWIRRVRGGAGQVGKATKMGAEAVGDAVDVGAKVMPNDPNMFQRAGGYMKDKGMAAGRHIGNNKMAYGAGAAGAAALGGGGYAASRYLGDDEEA